MLIPDYLFIIKLFKKKSFKFITLNKNSKGSNGELINNMLI